jgi:hypothetical protein
MPATVAVGLSFPEFRKEGAMGSDDLPRYDRDFLLSPTKRNQVIELWEVEKFGRDSFSDPDAFPYTT